MKMRIRLAAFWLSVFMSAAFGATVVAGQQIHVDLDPAKSRVEFTLGDVLHTVHGTFQMKRGGIRFDPASGKAEGELVVDATSGASGSKGRDQRMHRDILESQSYPEILFRPTRVEGEFHPEGASEMQVTGLFRLHGADHEMKAPATVQTAGTHVSGTVHFEVPYVKWGLKNPSTLFLRVSSQVEIDLHLDGSISVVRNRP